MPDNVKFIITDNNPLTTKYDMAVYSAVNAIVSAIHEPWQTVTKRLIEQAHIRANMPNYTTCLTDLLRASGFKKISTYGKTTPWSTFTETMQTDVAYIIKSDHFGYVSVTKLQDNIYARGYRFDERVTNRNIGEIWQHFPGTDNRTGILKAPERAMKSDLKNIKGKNMNPQNRIVGDCAVRALSGVLGCDWHKALDLLAETSDWCEPVVNLTANINATLSRLGFVQYEARTGGGKRYLHADELCNQLRYTCRNGEKIFAFVGNSHVVAILPEKQADNSVIYRIQDTWDSSRKTIRYYWVGLTESSLTPVKRPQIITERTVTILTEKIAEPEKEPVTDNRFAINSSVKHPAYGFGIVKKISIRTNDNMLEIEFPDFGTKIISEKWLRSVS